jgi:hypothetical protein
MSLHLVRAAMKVKNQKLCDELFRALTYYDKEFDDFYHGRTTSPPTIQELSLLRAVQDALTEAIEPLITSSRDEPLEEVWSEDMYTGQILRARIPKPFLKMAVREVRDTYHSAANAK